LKNNAFILTLAYPETIVMVADEWYSKYLHVVGIGKRKYVRAGHAALVLIRKETGCLEYHDFGRYITPEPYGRVRGRKRDKELDFPLKAEIEGDTIINLNAILQFLATHPKLTHGDGKLVASVCKSVNYEKARQHIDAMQAKEFIIYAAFKKMACNCARFVTDTLIESVTDTEIVNKLKRSKWFTPSTVGNVVLADSEDHVFEVDTKGMITEFLSNTSKENKKYFLDRLGQHRPNFIGTLEPKHNEEKKEHAQWLSGIAAGAWFELYPKDENGHYRFRRVSPSGYVDMDALFDITSSGFYYERSYQFVHYSNCLYFHIEQNGKRFRFNYKSELI
jgi:hypothetical protein